MKRARVIVVVVAAVMGTMFAGVPPAAAQARNWEQRQPPESPSARYGAAATYDGDSRRVVLFGGADAQVRKDTWLWDGVSWQKAPGSPNRGPSARVGSVMAYGDAQGHAVLFGGSGSSGLLGDTWVWDNSRWARRSPSVAPAARSGAAMAYDAARGVVVLFGGTGPGGLLGDTWTWDGSTWSLWSPVGGPPARHSAAMAYDSARGQVVLFGGEGAAGPTADTWVWDGSTWARRTPTMSPSARSGAGIAYDERHAEVVLFGGAASVTNDETWVWDGSDWARLNPPADPPARRQPAMVYDAASGEVMLFGGRVVKALNDTWALEDLPPTEAANFGGGQVSGVAHIAQPGIPVLGAECEPGTFTIEATAQVALGSSTLADYVGQVSIEGTGAGACEATSSGEGQLTLHAQGRSPFGSEVQCGPLRGRYTRVLGDSTVVLAGACILNGFSLGDVSFSAKLVSRPTAGDGLTQRITESAFDGAFVLAPE